MKTEEVLEKIKEGNPISIVRNGDGEAIILNGFDDMPSFKMVLKRQLGYYPPIDHCEEIRKNLIEAFRWADIIGVPKQKNLSDLNSYWQKAESLMEEHVSKLTPFRCSINLNYDLLEKDYYKDILTDQSVLNYISCRDLDNQLSDTFNIGQVNSFFIAPEMKFTSTYRGDKHYPDLYNRVQRWMDKCEIEGHICLVGAGVIGKIYCNWFRDRGGIAIDIGSVFDEWAGFATRGQGRGLDVAMETKYKL